MKSRNPSLLSNSGPPRRAAALPNRPNCIVFPLSLVHSLLRPFPAEPGADRIPHHQFHIAPLEPLQLFREHRHALPVRARHAGNIGTPEAALRAKSVNDLPDILVDIAVGIGLAR